MKLPEPLQPILDAIRGAGGRPLIAGGAVRDAALRLEPKDFDVEAYGIDIDALIAALQVVGRVNAVGRSFGVLKVAAGGLEVDVSLPRRESKAGRGHRGFLVTPDPGLSPREASSRRDFTINAMLYDPAAGKLLDFFGGLEDLERRVLRHTGPAFADDPLRVLRGMQFAGRFRLRAAPETVELSQRLFAEHSTLAVERVWAEWFKWAAKSSEPAAGLTYLAQAGWRAAYPELEALAGCPQDPHWHPEGDVWTHTLLATDHAARVAERDRLAEQERAVLVLAALCHDLGKPETTQIEGDHVRTPGHAACVGTYEAFLQRIGSPSRLATRAVGLSRHHLAHMDFTGSPRHVRRLARGLGQHGESIEMLSRLVEADHASRPPLPAGLPESMVRMLEVARELATADAAPRPLLLGRHLLEMGVKPGPQMGELLEAAYEAQLDGAFHTFEDARDWLLRRLPREPG